MCISPKTEPPPLSKLTPSICPAKASRVDLLLGGGAPAHAAAAGANLRARAPLDAAMSVVEDRSSHTVVASLPPFVSFALSLQNKLLSTSKPFRKKPCHVYCLVVQAWAPPPPAAMAPVLCSCRKPRQVRRRALGRPSVDHRSRLKTTSYPFTNLIMAADPPIDGSHLIMSPWTHGPAPWTWSTTPWTFSIHFSIEK
jgi:hypothetical protein